MMNTLKDDDNNMEGALKPSQRPRTRVANRHRTQTDITHSQQQGAVPISEPQAKPEKKSGWGESKDAEKSTGLLGKVFGRGDRHKQEEVPTELPYKGEIPKYMEEDEDDDLVSTSAIPTLTHDRQDLAAVSDDIAHAPDYHGNRVQSIGELDRELAFSLPPLRNPVDAHLDLSILSSMLPSSEQILEDDVVWNRVTFTQLLHGD